MLHNWRLFYSLFSGSVPLSPIRSRTNPTATTTTDLFCSPADGCMSAADCRSGGRCRSADGCMSAADCRSGGRCRSADGCRAADGCRSADGLRSEDGFSSVECLANKSPISNKLSFLFFLLGLPYGINICFLRK